MSIDVDPDTRALMRLQDRIRAGRLTPKERKVLAQLVGVVADSKKVETSHEAWLHITQERYDELLQTGDGTQRTGLDQ